MSGHRDLAWALRQQAKRTGERTPSVRGSDWRLATVTVVGTDGTVTADGIICRRMESYTMPLVGDVIAITQSSSGNWLAWGRPDGGTAIAWQSYTPAWTAATTNPVLGNGTITGRYMKHGRTCHISIRLVTGSTTTYGSGNYLFSVPVASADDIVEYVGAARLTAGGTYIGQTLLAANASAMNPTFPTAATPATATNMSPTTPIALASGHILRLTLTYQTAT